MERVAGLPALLVDGRLRRVTRVRSRGHRGDRHWHRCRRTRSVPSNDNDHSRPAAPSLMASAGAAKSGQLITVDRTNDALRDGHAGVLRSPAAAVSVWPPGRTPALVGLNGLSAHHVEGDDTTPMGLFGFQSTMYGVLPNPGVAYRVPPTRLR